MLITTWQLFHGECNFVQITHMAFCFCLCWMRTREATTENPENQLINRSSVIKNLEGNKIKPGSPIWQRLLRGTRWSCWWRWSSRSTITPVARSAATPLSWRVPACALPPSQTRPCSTSSRPRLPQTPLSTSRLPSSAIPRLCYKIPRSSVAEALAMTMTVAGAAAAEDQAWRRAGWWWSWWRRRGPRRERPLVSLSLQETRRGRPTSYDRRCPSALTVCAVTLHAIRTADHAASWEGRKDAIRWVVREKAAEEKEVGEGKVLLQSQTSRTLRRRKTKGSLGFIVIKKSAVVGGYEYALNRGDLTIIHSSTISLIWHLLVRVA